MEMFSAIRSSTLGITLFAVVTAALIAVTQVSTKERIAKNERDAQARALYEIVPKSTIDNDMLEDTVSFVAPELLGHDQPADAYLARKDGKVVAVILPVVAPDGYSGNINMIVGVKRDGSVAGVRVLAHKETPGLGDKVDLKKSGWILGLNNQRNDNDQRDSFAVLKDGGRFDQFTGATITPRAVVGATSRALDYFRTNKAALLEPAITGAE
ncbi:electron transport complex subunit RsxG [Pontibacterium granulatum]|uniref:electron transport complex subunit RsxG n=1 Tax=Pontibacterium granulatum TaxID=2036029 RepID=UPI00249CC250|nr:electron transport complex subunit RsxG [Pontibacterium granulatum]MDI3323547.1 electron transport complex subunit RsxG [Pontibacterium granulatum]